MSLEEFFKPTDPQLTNQPQEEEWQPKEQLYDPANEHIRYKKPSNYYIIQSVDGVDNKSEYGIVRNGHDPLNLFYQVKPGYLRWRYHNGLRVHRTPYKLKRPTLEEYWRFMEDPEFKINFPRTYEELLIRRQAEFALRDQHLND